MTKWDSKQSSAIETSYKIENLLVESLYTIPVNKHNAGTDQTARKRSLVCTFEVHKHQRQVFTHRGLYDCCIYFFGEGPCENSMIRKYHNKKTADKPMVMQGSAIQQSQDIGEDKLSKATSSLFPINMIAILE